MQMPQSFNQLGKSTEFKKSNVLPPLNVSPKPVHKSSSIVQNKNKTHQTSKKQESLLLQPSGGTQALSSVIKKQRKFILDEYDEKAIVLCQFCGGQACPQQDYKTNKKQPNAIEGLHSNWITQNILAMQRPSNRLIEKYNLIETFTKYGINSILNLQQPGEHPYCADGIDPMIGFSYDPQLFFTKNIRYENEFWEDMTATTFEQMMKIMNVFARSIVQKRGKISVHCHAGRGRTLMAICSWLIYHDRMTAEQTINLSIEKRQGVLTRTSQRDFLRNFQKQLQKRWRSYSLNIENERIKTFTQFVSWQNVSLLISERKKLHETPYAHGTILSVLRNRMKAECKEILYAFIDLNDKSVFGDKKWDKQHQHRVGFLKTYIDKKKLQHIKQTEDVRILVTLLEDFYDTLPFTPISLHAVDQLKQELNTQRQILKRQGTKRNVKKEQLGNKVLKTWDDILKERGQVMVPSEVVVKVNSKIIGAEEEVEENGQGSSGDIGLDSRMKDVVDRLNEADGGNDLNLETGQSNFPQSTIEQEEENAKGMQQSFMRSDFPNMNNLSQIQITTLYLNVLTQPSIVHEVGLNSLCTFIDFVKFAIELLDAYKTAYPKETPDHYKLVEKCLLAKFSLLLQSKKRYFPILFRGPHLRDSNLIKKIEKLEKYANKNIKYMAESFMRDLMEELQNVFGEEGMNGHKFEKLVFRIQKVDSNVDYFSKSHASSGGKFFSKQDAKKVYDEARI